MKKLALLLVLAALGLAACGGGSNAVAATVNGEDIRVGDIEALIDTGEQSTIPKETFAQFLGFDIQWRIVGDAAEDEFEIVVTDEDASAEADAIFEEAAQGMTREEFLETNGVTEEFLLQVARQQLLDEQVREVFAAEVEPPSQQDVDDVIAEAEALYCSSHILVATATEAEDVLARLDAGEDFALLAAELSTDAGSGAQGGDLGCSPPEAFVEEFAEALATAEVDVPTDPVETEFGFHVILLREDEVPTEDQVLEALSAQGIGEAANAWFIEQVEAAEVTVDETYGTWQANPPQVVPPTE
ncbi:MAG TPA: peptidylprolyl isomerase [Acidimicrobiia bacterium]|nr:peptidylprolyl isomerase [Acidimicrobiia bacterium]